MLGIVLSIGIAWGGALGAGEADEPAGPETAMQAGLCALAAASEAAAATCVQCLDEPAACAALPARLRAVDARAASVEQVASEVAIAGDESGRARDLGGCGDRWLGAERRLAGCMVVVLTLSP